MSYSIKRQFKFEVKADTKEEQNKAIEEIRQNYNITTIIGDLQAVLENRECYDCVVGVSTYKLNRDNMYRLGFDGETQSENRLEGEKEK